MSITLSIIDGSRTFTKNEMTNFDHSIDKGMEEDVRNGMVSHHNAWDFNAYIYFKDGKFYSEVWVHHVEIKTFEADSLQELMNLANTEFGDR